MSYRRQESSTSIALRVERTTRTARRRRPRYSLLSLLGVVIGGGVLFAAFRIWGGALLGRLDLRLTQTREMFPDMRVSEILPPICILCGILVGVLLSCVVYRMSIRRGFWLVGSVLFVCLIMAIWAASLDFPDYQETAVKHMSKRQLAFGLVMSGAVNLPLFSILGWCMSAVGRPAR